MCTSPYFIRNPFYHNPQYKSVEGRVIQLSSALQSHKEYIQVPCNKCAECRNKYYQSIFQRAVIEAHSSYLYFITLTYDNDHLPVVKIGNEEVYFADYEHLQNLFKRLRNNKILNRDFRYLSVNEFGTSYKRPHFHILLFVSKLDTDNDLTPYHIERLLYDKLKEYWAINIGSRKEPIYQSLFTYRHKYVNGKLISNYFCQYVEIDDNNETLYKTVSYLIGYVNKPSSFDEYVQSLVNKIYLDTQFSQKLLFKLRTKVRYSKGFGLGFENGTRVKLPRLQENCSSTSILLSDILDNLPENLLDFISDYPELYNACSAYIRGNELTKYRDFSDFYGNCDASEPIFLHIAQMYKMRGYEKIKRLSSSKLKPTILSYLSINKPYKLYFKKFNTSPLVNSPLYLKFREMLKFGLNNQLPILPFVYGDKVQPLCVFYKNLFTTPQDILNMYHSIGVTCYDEWINYFTTFVTSKRDEQRYLNNFTHDNQEIICINQKKYLDLPTEVKQYAFQLIL